MSNER